jgi:hypothetical protein
MFWHFEGYFCIWRGENWEKRLREREINVERCFNGLSIFELADSVDNWGCSMDF